MSWECAQDQPKGKGTPNLGAAGARRLGGRPMKVWSTKTRVEAGHTGRGGGAAVTWQAAVALPPHPTSRQDERMADQESWQEERG